MSPEIRSGKFTSTYRSALKPSASVCDISDPAVPGLVLRVATSGSKAWLFRFKWEGTGTRICLGKFPAVGLAEARQLAVGSWRRGQRRRIREVVLERAEDLAALVRIDVVEVPVARAESSHASPQSPVEPGSSRTFQWRARAARFDQ